MKVLTDRQLLFLDSQSVYELANFSRVCFPIQDHPSPDLAGSVREVVRDTLYKIRGLFSAQAICGQI